MSFWQPFKAAVTEFIQILIASVIVGAIVGTIIQIFLKLFFKLQNWAFGMFVQNHIYIIIIPLIGALITSLILHNKYFKPGHGWGAGPDVMITEFHDEEKQGQSHWSAGLVKFFAQLFGVGMGNSGGLVGPSARIGQGFISPLMHYIERIGVDRRQIAVMAMAAGIAGLLRTPVGAGVFVTELLHAGERIPKKYAIGGELAGMTAAATSFIAFDASPFFGYLPYTLEVSHLWWFAILGFLAGITALIFIKTFRFSVKFFEKLNVPIYVKPLIGSIIPAVFAFILLTMPIGGGNILTSFVDNKVITEDSFLILGHYGDENDKSKIAGKDKDGNILYIKDEFNDSLPYSHSTPTFLGFGADNVRMAKAVEYREGAVTMMIASQLEPVEIYGEDGKPLEEINGMNGYVNSLQLPVLLAIGLLLLIMFGKIFANSWYVGSFASGGMVMPAIIVGALMGGAFGLTLATFGFVEPSNIGGYVGVGALSVLAAMTNAPIGCAIFALVIFGFPFAVPALIGTMVAYQIAKFETIYETVTTIEKIMHKPIFVDPAITVLKSAETMAEEGVSSILMKDEEKIKVVTERDILKKIVAKNKDPSRIKASEIAVVATQKAYKTASIEDAADILDTHHIRHLPIAEKNEGEDRLVGIITSRDIVEAPFSYLHVTKTGSGMGIKVEEIMREVIVIKPEMSVLDAAKIMTKKDADSIFTRSGGLHGIVTERDILTKVVAKNLPPGDVKVVDIASGVIITINAGKTIKDAIEIFEKSHIRHLPIMKEGKVVGMITTRDAAKTIAAD